MLSEMRLPGAGRVEAGGLADCGGGRWAVGLGVVEPLPVEQNDLNKVWKSSLCNEEFIRTGFREMTSELTGRGSVSVF